jgi:uncharacterized protein (DUF4415 family)
MDQRRGTQSLFRKRHPGSRLAAGDLRCAAYSWRKVQAQEGGKEQRAGQVCHDAKRTAEDQQFDAFHVCRQMRQQFANAVFSERSGRHRRQVTIKVDANVLDDLFDNSGFDPGCRIAQQGICRDEADVRRRKEREPVDLLGDEDLIDQLFRKPEQRNAEQRVQQYK